MPTNIKLVFGDARAELSELTVEEGEEEEYVAQIEIESYEVKHFIWLDEEDATEVVKFLNKALDRQDQEDV